MQPLTIQEMNDTVTSGAFRCVQTAISQTSSAPPSHTVNWPGMEGIPLPKLKLAAITETSLDTSPSALMEKEWNQLRVHTEMLLRACESCAHNSPALTWHLLKEDSSSFFPLLRFSFPLQRGFNSLRCYPELNLPTKLDDLKGQTRVQCILCVKPILATCPDSLF